MVAEHRRQLMLANLLAVLGTLAAVPVPLLMPVLVDEVLLEQPGAAVAFMDRVFPAAWHGPVLYVAGRARGVGGAPGPVRGAGRGADPRSSR
jgi:ATP-binding cassette subfamily C protein